MTKFRELGSTTDGTPKQSTPDCSKLVPYACDIRFGGMEFHSDGNSPNFGMNTKSSLISNSITEYNTYRSDENNSASIVNRSSKEEETEELPYKAGLPGRFHLPPYSFAPSPLASQYRVNAILYTFIRQIKPQYRAVSA